MLCVLLMLPFAVFAATGDCPDLNMLQRIAGYASWMGLLQVVIGITLLGGILFMFWGAVEALLAQESLLEVLIWISALTLTVGAHFLETTYRTWILIAGAGLWAGAIAFSAHVHKKKPDPFKFSATLMVIWMVLALFYHSDAIGFMAVGAFLSALGFSVLVTPGCYAFGYEKEDAIPSGTVSGLMLTIIYGAVRAFHVEFGMFSVFESGALWLGSLVGFIGLLILSSSWYDRKRSGAHQFMMNVVMIVMLAITISFGVFADVRELSTMGGAFLIFYVAGKVAEVETTEYFAFGLKLLCICAVFAGAWYVLDHNQATFAPYLLKF